MGLQQLSPEAISYLAARLRQDYTDDEIRAVTDQYGVSPWPKVYVNSETGHIYRPHHEMEAAVVYSDDNRFLLVAGGEGGGQKCTRHHQRFGAFTPWMFGLLNLCSC